MLTARQKRKIVAYYRKPESLWGYRHFLWGSKHFGYYPNKRADISEEQAQLNLQDLVAAELRLQSGQKVLDAGCGEGVVATYLAERYAVKVTGVTLVPFEKRVAQRRSARRGQTGSTAFRVMDYTDTSFKDGFFDAIYTTETLSHVPVPADAFREFYRLLKPGGRLALFEYALADDEHFSDADIAELDFVIKGSGMFGFKKIRHGRLPSDIRQAGFTGVRQQNVTEHIDPSFERLYRAATGPYRYIRRLGLRRVFINTTASVEYYKLVKKGLIRYYIFTAVKPKI